MSDGTITVTAISLLGLLFVSRRYNRFRRGRFRSDIRCIRDSLFDYMWQNGYSFDSPGYRETRRMLNGMLRASNWMSVVGLTASAWYSKRHPMPSPLLDAVNSVEDDQLRSRLKAVIDEAVSRMVRFLILETACGHVLFFMYSLALAGRFLKEMALAARQAVMDLARLTINDFYDLGSPSLSLDKQRLLPAGFLFDVDQRG